MRKLIGSLGRAWRFVRQYGFVRLYRKVKELLGDAEKEQMRKDLAVQEAVTFLAENAVETEEKAEEKEVTGHGSDVDGRAAESH